MEGIKILISGAVLALLLGALALADRKVAGEQSGLEFSQNNAHLTDVLEATLEAPTAPTAPEAPDAPTPPDKPSAPEPPKSPSLSEVKGSVNSVNMDVSISASSSSEVNVSSDTSTSATVTSPESDVEASVNGLEVSCGPGQVFRTRTVRCRNTGNNVDFSFSGSKGNGSNSLKIKFHN